jgi:RNA polymerase sigma factor (sigma-70 family)
MPSDPATPSFADVFAGLDHGDQEAARKLYERFIDQLIRLAGRKLKYQLGSAADPESVAHSVFESFFEGVQRKRFELRNWGMVFGLLAHIAFRKCLRRKREEMQGRRIPGGKLNPLEGWEVVTAAPGPEEEAMVADLLATALEDLDADERSIIEEYMKGVTVDGVARQVKLSERTVHRVVARFRTKLQELMDRE